MSEMNKLVNLAKQWITDSDENFTRQIQKMDEVNAPQWEIDVLIQLRANTRKSYRLFYKSIEDMGFDSHQEVPF